VTLSLEGDADVRRVHAADASGLVLLPDYVARPGTTAETAEMLRMAAARGMTVTPAGMQTSTTGASVTDTGVLLSLRGMQRILDLDPVRRCVRVEAGANLGDVRRAAASEGLLLAPDPTSSDECSVGGAVACNASGPRTLRYGPTRAHVRGLTVVLASGEIVTLTRHALEKNAAGYAFAHDPVDWFVGSEGTLGVLTEVELALVPLPEHVIGLEIPFASEPAAMEFVVHARRSPCVAPRCIEYFDGRAAAIAWDAAAAGEYGARAPVLYVEEETTSDQSRRSEVLDAWLALAEARGALVADARVFEGEMALAEARRARHRVPAIMNERAAAVRAAGGRKVSTDWAVPYERLGAVLANARGLADAAGVEPAVTYGHVGNGHPHQNFIARDADEVAVIERVVEATLRDVIAAGGTVSAEHGIGKLKRRWLPWQATVLQLTAMRGMKRALDPMALLAPGNIFAPGEP